MKILIAEDNFFYRLTVKKTLQEWGFDVVEAEDGDKAWSILKSLDPPQLAILDWMMPGKDGVTLCHKVRALRRPEPTYIIMLTSLEGNDNIVAALDGGADDFIHKPFDREQLRARIQVGKRIVGMQTMQTVVFAFARAVEAKSPYTQGHVDRVTIFALEIGKALGLGDEELDILQRGALLHDIGKISIPEHILDKPTKLTEEEFAIVKKHPCTGVDMVRPLQNMQDVIPLIRWHHERMDGGGYPDGIAGDDIPMLVRILSVADVYDALTSERPYRMRLSHDQSLKIMLDNAENGGLDLQFVRQLVEFGPEILEKATKRPSFSEIHLPDEAILLQQDSA